MDFNGLNEEKTFGNLNVDGICCNVDGISQPNNGEINTITLRFELHVRPYVGEASQTPINVPYIKFSMFDFDELPPPPASDDPKGREVSRAPWPCLWLRPTRVTHHFAVRRSFGVLRLCALRSYRRNNSNNATGV